MSDLYGAGRNADAGERDDPRQVTLPDEGRIQGGGVRPGGQFSSKSTAYLPGRRGRGQRRPAQAEARWTTAKANLERIKRWRRRTP